MGTFKFYKQKEKTTQDSRLFSYPVGTSVSWVACSLYPSSPDGVVSRFQGSETPDLSEYEKEDAIPEPIFTFAYRERLNENLPF